MEGLLVLLCAPSLEWSGIRCLSKGEEGREDTVRLVVLFLRVEGGLMGSVGRRGGRVVGKLFSAPAVRGRGKVGVVCWAGDGGR